MTRVHEFVNLLKRIEKEVSVEDFFQVEKGGTCPLTFPQKWAFFPSPNIDSFCFLKMYLLQCKSQIYGSETFIKDK